MTDVTEPIHYNSLQAAMVANVLADKPCSGAYAIYQVFGDSEGGTLKPDLVWLPDLDSARAFIADAIDNEFLRADNPLSDICTPLNYMYGLFNGYNQTPPYLTREWTGTSHGDSIGHVPIVAPQLPMRLNGKRTHVKPPAFETRRRQDSKGTFSIIAYEPAELNLLVGCPMDQLPALSRELGYS